MGRIKPTKDKSWSGEIFCCAGKLFKNTLVDFNSCRQELGIYCDGGSLRFIMFIKPFKATFSLENEFLILKFF